MVRMGEEVTERHTRPKYACGHCEGSGDDDKPAVRVAPAPPSILPGSIVTPRPLTSILVNKFDDHLTFYQQEAQFEHLEIHISRHDMSDWAIGVAKKLAPSQNCSKTRFPVDRSSTCTNHRCRSCKSRSIISQIDWREIRSVSRMDSPSERKSGRVEYAKAHCIGF